jgi:hypothetical protein
VSHPYIGIVDSSLVGGFVALIAVGLLPCVFLFSV